MGQPVDSSASIASGGLAAPPATNPPPPPAVPVSGAAQMVHSGPENLRPSPPPPAPEAPVAPPRRPKRKWYEVDEETILEILRDDFRRHDDLPRGVDLLMSVFGRLRKTDYSLGDVEELVADLRRRFQETDALLCSGSGGPAPGHELRLYTSLEVWGAARKPAPGPAKNAPGPKNRPRQMAAPLPAKKMRYEVMRVKYPRLAAKVDKMTRKALEGLSDMTAWSLELKLKNQKLAGVSSAARTKDRAKELTGFISTLI
uniref:Uncharacterized protein n=1 Tax=Oryza brachyantha TaxID=4533 RepID=J3N1A8_ORYBR